MFDETGDRPVVPGADRAAWCSTSRRSLAARSRASPRGTALPEAEGLFRPAPGQAARHEPARSARRAPRAGRPTGLQARGHLRRRVRHADGLHVLDLRTRRRRVRGRADRPQEDHGAGRRAEPHRPGHRVRLLLRACRAGDARGRLRDHHGQLQPRDRVDRLRHLGPPVLRAGDARGRARDRRQGKAGRRDRAVRRPDAAEAGARPGARRRTDRRHVARFSIDIAEDRERFQKLLHTLGLKQPPNRTARTEEAGDCCWRRRSATRWWCARATCWAAARWKSCTATRTSSATCARP